MSNKVIRAEEFDKKFDDGEDISEYIDFDSLRPPNAEQKPISIELPLWIVKGLDKEAQRLGVTRQSVIKTWLAEKLA
ncbi:MAG: CopG family antitoxin [Cyanobacteria bacterium P01_F01_bin.143]